MLIQKKPERVAAPRFQCIPRDTFGNKVVDNNLFIQARSLSFAEISSFGSEYAGTQAEFVNMDDSSAPA